MNRRRVETRNELKRDVIRTVFLTVAIIALWAVLTIKAIGVWTNHPAEQMISGSEYLASLQA